MEGSLSLLHVDIRKNSCLLLIASFFVTSILENVFEHREWAPSSRKLPEFGFD